jgi:hypothetical protein
MFVLSTIWVLLIVTVFVLAVVRKRIAGQEDESLHVLNPERAIAARPQSLTNLLNRFDRWNLALIIAIAAYGVLLLARYLYLAWQQGPNFNW